MLLARRLIEAGTRAVTFPWAPDANATWDTHGSNFLRLQETLLPQFDAACSGLIADLAGRGMLERTIVAVLGDFGRSPKVKRGRPRPLELSATACCWPAAVSRRGYVTAPATAAARFPPATHSRRPTSSPRCISSWESRPTRFCTINSAAPIGWCPRATPSRAESPCNSSPLWERLGEGAFDEIQYQF